MAPRVVHAKVDAIPDDPIQAAQGRVVPSDWNADHTITGLATVAGTGAYSDLTGTPTVPAAANPTASVGLAAVNGSAGTFMRSDGAPALDQTAAFAFTGLGNTTLATNSVLRIWDGAVGTPGLRGSDADSGIYFSTSGTQTNITVNGVQGFAVNGTNVYCAFPLQIGSGGSPAYLTSTSPNVLKVTAEAAATTLTGILAGNIALGGAANAILTGPATATTQLGAANAASPVAQTLQAQGSRAGTDSNIGGANLTVAPGTGTGTGTLSSLILQSPVAVASGTGAQTQTTGLTIKGGQAVLPTYTVGTLPTGIKGGMAQVTDGDNALAWGATVINSGAGATYYKVNFNGTNWTVVGK